MDRALMVYVLRFSAVVSLTRAFDRISASPEVASCSFELTQRRVRLLAPRAVAEAIVERLYLEGGLAWCSRHPCEPRPPAATLTLRAPASAASEARSEREARAKSSNGSRV